MFPDAQEFGPTPPLLRTIKFQHRLHRARIQIAESDQRTDEAPKAYVVAKDPDLTAEMIIDHCRDLMTNYKLPRHVQFVDEIPKSPVGKILRKDLRKLDQSEANTGG